MHWRFSLAFVKPISSNTANANHQIVRNSKDEVSFLHFLKLVIWVNRNSVGIPTHLILCNLQKLKQEKKPTSYIKQESLGYKTAERSWVS